MSLLVVRQLTVFERIPDLFVEVYDKTIQHWARNFTRLGPMIIVKLTKPLEPSALAKDQRRIVGVRLKAEVERGIGGKVLRVVIRPADDANAEAIARHCADLRAMVN